MAYSYTNSKGSTYYLHYKDQPLKNTDKIQRLHFFAKEIGGKSGDQKTLDEVPAGYKVVESERTGLPFLKKA